MAGADSVADNGRSWSLGHRKNRRNDVVKKSLELDVSLDEDSLQDIKGEYVTAEAVGCFPRHFLPETLGLRINVAEEEARQRSAPSAKESPRGLRRRHGTRSRRSHSWNR